MKVKNDKFQVYLLIAILVIAGVGRFYLINQPYIDATSWRQSDTATIADNFYRGNWNIFYPEISWNGPGHNYVGYEFQTVTYIAALLYRILGQHDWVGRLVSISFGLWGIFAFYHLVRCVWGVKHAIVAAAILAILPGEVYVDRSFLPDPVMLSLTMTSAWLLISYLQTERLHYLALASLTGMLGFLTKVSGAAVGIPMLYAVLTMLHQKHRLVPKQFALLGIAATVTLLPVVLYYRWAIHISHAYPPYYIAAGGYWVWKFGLEHFLEQNYFLPKLLSQLNWFWTTPLILLFAIGLFLSPPRNDFNFASQQQKATSKAPWFFHWWLAAFVAYYLVAAKGLVDNPTNLNLINPAAAALAARALIVITSWIQRLLKSPNSFALIAVVLLMIAGFGHQKLKQSFLLPFSENSHNLGLALRQVSQPDDLVVTVTIPLGDTVAIYYSQRRGWMFPPAYTWSTIGLNLKDELVSIRLLDELLLKGANWFGIVDKQRNQLQKDNPKFIDYVERTFERYQEKPGFVIYRIPHASKNQ